jgi:hypothetical protein
VTILGRLGARSSATRCNQKWNVKNVGQEAAASAANARLTNDNLKYTTCRKAKIALNEGPKTTPPTWLSRCSLCTRS